MSVQELIAAELGSLVEPVVWKYTPSIDSYLSKDIWDKYATVFGSVWIASAYKGATGPDKIVTDISKALFGAAHPRIQKMHRVSRAQGGLVYYMRVYNQLYTKFQIVAETNINLTCKHRKKFLFLSWLELHSLCYSNKFSFNICHL